MNISLFKNGKSVEPQPATLADIVVGISTGAWSATVAECRRLLAERGKETYKNFRTNKLAHISTHVVFKTRGKGTDADRFAGFTGLCQLDYDGLTVAEIEDLRQKVVADRHVAASYVSPSGVGYKVLLRVPVADDRADYIARIAPAAERHALRVHGRQPEHGTLCDPARLCCVSHDAVAYFNADAPPIEAAPGVPVGERHDTIKRLVASGVARGLAEKAIFAEVRSQVPDRDKTDDEIRALINWCREKQGDGETQKAEAKKAAAASLPSIYYGGKSGYAIEHNGGFIPLNERACGQHVKHAGGKDVDVAAVMCGVRLHNFVEHIGPVAGYDPGLHTSPDSGTQFLVTVGPRIVPAAPGPWPFIGAFIGDLFGEGDQREAALAWLRQARLNLLARRRRPLPAAVLVGPRNCGKSLFIEVARLALGGRCAPAFPALSGQSNFNGDILGAELLTIDDEIAQRDHRARTTLAQGIKKHLFAQTVRIEGKHREAASFRPVQAVIIAVNDEPEHLQVLPAMDDSVADKISLFECGRASLDGLDDREEIARRIAADMPGFLAHIEATEHPAWCRDQRTGAAAYHAKAVMDRLRDIAPEERLRELMLQCAEITEALASVVGKWCGTSAELERALLNNTVTAHAARQLLSWQAACGAYLARLATSGRATIKQTVVRGVTRWTVTDLETDRDGEARQNAFPF